jgi:signal transduction histidine kinase
MVNRRSGGELYPVDLTISPIRDEQGGIVSLLGIHRDITLARQYQESLETEVAARTREIAETQGLTAMGEMASMIAHDLRNALSTVKMNLQILFRRHSTPGDGEQEYCQIGLEQVAYMEEILRDMLSYARPERLRADWHDMAPIVDDALAMVAQGETENGITFSRQDGKGLPKVYCDRVRIVEVLGNLVDNAMQAMPDGGSVEIQTHLLIDASAPMVQVSVQDSGIGIPEDARAQVFEPFFTTRSKGTGLGLTIVRRIVEEHGGSIRIDPRQGRGTSVIFTLPTVPSDP